MIQVQQLFNLNSAPTCAKYLGSDYSKTLNGPGVWCNEPATHVSTGNDRYHGHTYCVRHAPPDAVKLEEG